MSPTYPATEEISSHRLDFLYPGQAIRVTAGGPLLALPRLITFIIIFYFTRFAWGWGWKGLLIVLVVVARRFRTGLGFAYKPKIWYSGKLMQKRVYPSSPSEV